MACVVMSSCGNTFHEKQHLGSMQRRLATDLLEEGGGDGHEELRRVGGLEDGAPRVGHKSGALAGRLDVLELLLHVVNPPYVPQHLSIPGSAHLSSSGCKIADAGTLCR